MTDLMLTGRHSDGDLDLNASDNPTFGSIVEARQSRRAMLGGMVAVASLFGLSACDSGSNGSDPVITAGAVGATSSGKQVTLSGSGQGVVQTQWTQVSGPAVTLSAAEGSTVTFIAPAVATSTALVFRLTALNGAGRTTTIDTTVTVGPAVLDFTAVAKNLNDVVTVPADYTVNVLFRLGDPINGATPAYANNGTDTNFASRAGDHHDAIYYYGLAAFGSARDDNNSSRGLLVNNHENITEQYLHVNGPTSVGGVRPEAEAIKEIECHGVSVIEVSRSAAGWTYNQTSTFNRRITPNTPMVFNGPARGDAAIRTAFSPTGLAGRGTINNCANGYAPWGTNLTCEENWAGYFRRPSSDNANRTARQVVGLNRYGVSSSTGANSWSTVVPSTPGDTRYARWNAVADPLAAADGSGDFRNEPNQYGWVVEIDPYDPASTPRKRTALGRMAHEGAWPSNFVAGQRPAFYMGDDSRNEYFYKFVSAMP
ncbi:MAG TPA: alkaline phosphatase PhoX, partial [Brevundimonas sp.]|nr:alkaline phosphatase PhoX [Brevundimonas sp.]